MHQHMYKATTNILEQSIKTLKNYVHIFLFNGAQCVRTQFRKAKIKKGEKRNTQDSMESDTEMTAKH